MKLNDRIGDFLDNHSMTIAVSSMLIIALVMGIAMCSLGTNYEACKECRLSCLDTHPTATQPGDQEDCLKRCLFEHSCPGEGPDTVMVPINTSY